MLLRYVNGYRPSAQLMLLLLLHTAELQVLVDCYTVIHQVKPTSL